MTSCHPDLGDPEAAAINRHMERPRMTPCDCNREMGDRCAKCAPTNIVPPKVGDRWGDLSPAQRAMVPDGSLLHFAEDRETCEKEHGSWPYEAMHDNNVIVRLGPAPTATPEPDRSGWPVLVRYDESWLNWPTNEIAVQASTERAGWFRAWHRGAITHDGEFYPTTLAAADAIRARLPDEVGEANSSLAEESKPAPRVERCAETSTNRGERCIKALVDGAAHEGLHMFVVGDTTQGLGEHRPQAEAAGLPGAVIEAAQTVAPQPPPTNTAGDVWQELIDAEPPGRIRDLMVARRTQGIAKYGRPLGRENGRNHTADAIQEALDGMVYAKAANDDLACIAFDAALRRLLGYRGPSKMKMRAEAAEHEAADLRSQVEAFRRAACVATGWGEDTTPGDSTLLRDLRAMDIKNLMERAESAEATLDAYRIQRDQAREDAAGLRRLLNDAAALRAAAAEACDCDDGEAPADAELARRLRELAREPQDLALVRRVVGIQTAALRKLISEDSTFRDIAIALAADTIDAVVGVRP